LNIYILQGSAPNLRRGGRFNSSFLHRWI